MATKVTVDLGNRSYDIHIASGLLPQLGALAAPFIEGRNGLLVTDASVAGLHGKACADALSRSGVSLGRAVVPAGEGSKDGRCLFHLYEQAVEQGLDRQSFVVALGGGVVGDLAGFLAATYLRGIRLIQVPTTLLAMVDSAIGGKTGINLPQGKNLVGAFHQPVLVVCDLATLKTLPRREFAAGLAEVIKYGVIRDPALFDLVEKGAEAIWAGDPATLEEVVARSSRCKAGVVHQDEREESGVRAILNFGHTLGHAVEAVAGYGRYLHGEAIAIGMVFAGRLSAALRRFPVPDLNRLIHLLKAVGLPIQAPELAWEPLRRVIGTDKKGVGGKPRFVLADRLGSVSAGHEAPEDLLKQIWESKPGASALGF